MAHNDSKFPEIRLSILDRLSEYFGRDYVYHTVSVDDLVNVVERDLENLLNNPRLLLSIPADKPCLRPSLLDYGVPDLMVMSLNSHEHQKKITDAIQTAIECYEPRLRNPKVELINDQKKTGAILSFRINAILLAEPNELPVQFSSTLKSDTHLFAIENSLVPH